MAQARINPGQSKRPIDIKDPKTANEKESKRGLGFELSAKDNSSKGKESRNNQ